MEPFVAVAVVPELVNSKSVAVATVPNTVVPSASRASTVNCTVRVVPLDCAIPELLNITTSKPTSRTGSVVGAAKVRLQVPPLPTFSFGVRMVRVPPMAPLVWKSQLRAVRLQPSVSVALVAVFPEKAMTSSATA